MNLLKAHKANILVSRFLSVLSIDILVKASGLILLPIFLRLMTQEEFGLYSYIISIIQTFSLILNFGLYVPQSKLYYAYNYIEKGKLLFTIAVCLFFFNILLIALSFILGLDDLIIKLLFGDGINYGKYKLLIAISVLVSVFVYMLTNFFYASEKIHQVKKYNILRTAIINVFAVAALFLIHTDTVGIRLGFTYGLELLLLCFFASQFVKEIVPEFDKSIMRRSLAMGLPIMISAIFGIIVNFGDKFLLKKYGSLTDLSNYYLAFSFASIIPLIFASFQNVWLPIFLKEKSLERNLQQTKLQVIRLILVFSLLSIAIWTLFLLLFWVGIIPYKYNKVTWILPLLLVTQIVASITPLLSNYLIYFEKTKLVSVAGFFISGVTIGVGMWLIPLWGILGAVTTTFVANLFYLVIYYYLVIYLKNKYLSSANLTPL